MWRRADSRHRFDCAERLSQNQDFDLGRQRNEQISSGAGLKLPVLLDGNEFRLRIGCGDTPAPRGRLLRNAKREGGTGA